MRNFVIDGAGPAVGAGKIAGAHEKFVGDFASGKMEGFLKQLDPVVLGSGVVMVEPGGK